MFSHRCLVLPKLNRATNKYFLIGISRSFSLVKEASNKNDNARHYTFFQNNSYQKNISTCIVKKIPFRKYSTKVSNVCEEESVKIESTDSKNEEEDLHELFKIISNGNEAVEKQLKILEFEVDILKEQEPGRVPTVIRKHQWEELLKLPSILRRKKYLNFLFVTEKKREASKLKKQRELEERTKKLQEMIDENHLVYALGRNSLFMRVYDRSLANLTLERHLAAEMFSQNIVLDFSYESYMSEVNAKYCGHQIALSYNNNRRHPAPFHVKMCNIEKNCVSLNYFKKCLPSANSKLFPWEYHEESYLDLYPKEKLVYLTPHCKNELVEYNHDDVYIIGSFVDKGSGLKASLAIAKELDLRMAKLPLDNYLIWQKGVKSLPINIVFNILLDMRIHNDWKRAFQHIPSRFLTPHKPKASNENERITDEFIQSVFNVESIK